MKSENPNPVITVPKTFTVVGHKQGESKAMNLSGLKSIALIAPAVLLLVVGCGRTIQMQEDAKAERLRHDWRSAESADTIDGYEQFLAKHSDPVYSYAASKRLNKLRAPKAWEETRSNDTIAAYEAFLSQYSATEFASDARARLSFLKGEAVVVFQSPRVMRRWGSRYNWSYRWDAKFRESGGKSGFKVTATDFYVLGRGGTKWSNSWAPTVEVQAGGFASVDWWVDPADNFIGGKFHCVWIGRDDTGAPIRIEQWVDIPNEGPEHSFR